jgi:hypothetical protein
MSIGIVSHPSSEQDNATYPQGEYESSNPHVPLKQERDEPKAEVKQAACDKENESIHGGFFFPRVEKIIDVVAVLHPSISIRKEGIDDSEKGWKNCKFPPKGCLYKKEVHSQEDGGVIVHDKFIVKEEVSKRPFFCYFLWYDDVAYHRCSEKC